MILFMLIETDLFFYQEYFYMETILTLCDNQIFLCSILTCILERQNYNKKIMSFNFNTETEVFYIDIQFVLSFCLFTFAAILL